MKTPHRVFAFVLGVLAVLSLVGYDCLGNVADPYGNGEARYLMLAAAICVTFVLFACNPFWAFFWGWSFAQWIVTDWPTYGMMDVVMIGAVLVVGDACRWTFRPAAVCRTMGILACLEAAYVILQRLGLDPFFHFEGRFHNEAIGTIGHYTLVGPFIGLGAVYFFARGLHDRKNLAGWILCIVGLALCHSTMTSLSCTAGMLYIAWRRVPSVGYWTGIVLGCWIAIWKIYRPRGGPLDLDGRQVVWPYVWRQWLESPIFGHGPGYWAGVLPITNIQGVGSDRWYQAHNDFLQVLTEQGLVGLAVVLVGLCVLMKKAQKMPTYYGAAIVLLCVDASANYTLHVPCFGLIAAWLASEVYHFSPAPAGKTMRAEDLWNKSKL